MSTRPADELRASEAASERSARPAATLFFVCALGAALGARAGLPGGVAHALALPLWLGGAAFPLLLAWAPPRPSLLKVGWLAWLLSPPLLAALVALLRRAFAPADACGVALVLVAGLQALGARRSLRAERPGRAAWCVLALSALLGAGVLALHGQVPLLRVFGDGLWHAGGVAVASGQLPPGNPWMVGAALDGSPAWDALGASGVLVLGAAPTRAGALLAAWAAASLPLSLYFLAAPLWREGRRALLGVLLGLFGWNAAGGLLWLARGRPQLGGAGRRAWLAELGLSLPTGSGGAHLTGLAELLGPGPLPAALALATAGWAAAAHALRRGARPWVGLTGLLLGLAASADGGVGAAAVAAVAVAALVAPGAPIVRPKLLLALLAGALPALVLGRAGARLGPATAELAPPGLGALALASAALLAGTALLSSRPRGPRFDAGQRPIAALLVAAPLACAAVAWLAPLPSAAPGAAGRLGGMALAVLAGGGIAGAWGARGGARLLSACVVGPTAAGAVLALELGLGAHLEQRAHPPALVERGARLEPLPRPGLDADACAAHAWLRAHRAELGPGAFLVLGERQEPQRLPLAQRPHPAPLFSDLPLWADRSEPSARAHPRLAARVANLRALLERDSLAAPSPTAEFDALGGPALLWIGAAERASSDALEWRLERAGFERLQRFGAVELWTWPRAAAAVRAAEREEGR